MALKRLPVLSFLAPDICGPCGGYCCQSMPGITSPEDWGAPDRDTMRERLTAAFRTGAFAIDRWDGRSPRDYVRPATKDKVGVLRDASSGGTCALLGPGGCALPHAARPEECRALEPRDDLDCTSHRGSKKEFSLRWKPYAAVIAAAERACGTG